MVAHLVVELYCGLEGLEYLRHAWESVLGDSPRARYYQSWEWWRASLGTLFPESASMLFFLISSGGLPLAIIPMQRRASRWHGMVRNEIGLPDHPHLPLQDIVCREGVDARALLSRWRQTLRDDYALHWDVMDFRQVPEGSSLIHALPRHMMEKADAPPCNVLECDVPYEQMLARFSNNFRTSLRKARNRWLKAAQPHYFSADRPGALEETFEEFLRIEACGWKGKQGTAIAQNPALLAFYTALIERFGPQGRVRINCLAAEGKVIAAQFCLADADTLYLLKIAYDEQWEKCSPGNLLLEQLLQECAEGKRYRTVSLVTDAAWHCEWRPVQQKVRTLRLFNNTTVGTLAWLESTARTRLRTPYRRLGQWRAAPGATG